MLTTLFGTPEPDYSIPSDKLPFEHDLKTAFEIYRTRLEDWQRTLFISTAVAFVSVLVVLSKSALWLILVTILTWAFWLILLKWVHI